MRGSIKTQISDPLALIAALEEPHHKLMAALQYYCGCRTEGVGAPQREHHRGVLRMSAISIVTGHDALTARQILSWFAKQAEEVQIRIIRRKYGEFMRLKNTHPTSSKSCQPA